MKINPQVLLNVISFFIFIYSILLIEFLHYFFPGIGPASMATYPLTYLVGIMLSILCFKTFKKITTTKARIGVFISFFTLMTYMAFDLHESVTVDALRSSKDAIRIILNPKQISFEDIFSENRTYSIAGMVKFKSELPEYLYSCTYEQDYSEFYTFYLWKSGKKIGSTNKYWVIDSLSRRDTFIFKDVVKGARYEVIAPPALFSDPDQHLFKEIFGDLKVCFWPIRQNMNRGFETWFYHLLDKRWNR